MSILLYAEVTREKYIHTVFFELAAKASQLSSKTNNQEIYAVIFAEKNLVNKLKDGFCNNNIDKVFVFEHDFFKNYSTETYTNLIVELIKEINPSIFLIGATNQGRDLAPRISANLHAGLTADCTELDINSDNMLAATRPTFGGKLMATILSKTTPQMATVRPNVFKPSDEIKYKNTEFVYREIKETDLINNIVIENFVKNFQKLSQKRLFLMEKYIETSPIR